MSFVGKGTVLCEGRDANQIDRNCQDISAITLLSFQRHARLR